jgi:hypothetical protein
VYSEERPSERPVWMREGHQDHQEHWAVPASPLHVQGVLTPQQEASIDPLRQAAAVEALIDSVFESPFKSRMPGRSGTSDETEREMREREREREEPLTCQEKQECQAHEEYEGIDTQFHSGQTDASTPVPLVGSAPPLATPLVLHAAAAIATVCIQVGNAWDLPGAPGELHPYVSVRWGKYGQQCSAALSETCNPHFGVTLAFVVPLPTSASASALGGGKATHPARMDIVVFNKGRHGHPDSMVCATSLETSRVPTVMTEIPLFLPDSPTHRAGSIELRMFLET